MAAFRVLLLIFLSIVGKYETQMNQLLPKESEGWKPQDKTATYNRETLYDYINGAAEIYLTYSFKDVIVQRYTKKNNPEILVEIFDMGNPEDAFGIFSHSQGRGSEVNIGQNSEYKRGLLCFWKDRYFVCIRAEKENKKVKKVIQRIAKSISNNILTIGELPYLISILPIEQIDKKSIRYFHKYEILNYHYFVAEKNILHLNENTNAVLGKYSDDNSYLLVIEYQNEEHRKNACNEFVNTFVLTNSDVVQTENGKWTTFSFVNNFMIIIFDAMDTADAIKKRHVIERRIAK